MPSNGRRGLPKRGRAMLDRRQFLSGAAGITVGFTLAPFNGVAQDSQSLPPMVRRNPKIDSWLQIGADGIVRVFTGRAELGQGIQTALAQIVADELDLGWNGTTYVQIETVDTERSADEGYTFGSVSIQLGGAALRHAAAFLRQLTIEHASELLGLPASELEFDRRGVAHYTSRRFVSHAEIAESLPASVDIGEAVAKPVGDYENVGRDIPRVDIPPKVFGDPIYIQDFRPPGVVHARVVKPPAYQSRLLELNAESLDGNVDVVRDGSFVAVLADNEYRAVRMAEEVRPLASWSTPSEPQEDWLEASDAQPNVVHESGEAVSSSARTFEASYGRPFQSHATLSPSMALAQYADGVLTVWSHAQGMYPLRGAVAAAVGLEETNVRCIHMQASGVYGQNGADDAACDAGIIAMARPGTMVRLQYSREDEFRTEPLGSAMRVALSAATDSDGRIRRWEGEVSSGPHSTRPNGRAGAGYLDSAVLLERPLQRPTPRPIGLPRGGADRNAIPYYAFDSTQISTRFIPDTPVRVSALRSLGAYANTFAIESFVDEIAAAYDSDPFDFRLRHTTDERARAVLESLRTYCKDIWGGDYRGIGIGFGRYKNSAAYCGVAVEVVVDETNGNIRATRAVSVVDAGLVINPDGVRNQIEGGIVQSTSWTLKEQAVVEGRARSSVDWATYPILRFSEVPQVSVEIISRPGEPSLGVGEASQGPTAAAIANAIAASTGVRLRQTPLRYADWLAASQTFA